MMLALKKLAEKWLFSSGVGVGEGGEIVRLLRLSLDYGPVYDLIFVLLVSDISFLKILSCPFLILFYSYYVYSVITFSKQCDFD